MEIDKSKTHQIAWEIHSLLKMEPVWESLEALCFNIGLIADRRIHFSSPEHVKSFIQDIATLIEGAINTSKTAEEKEND